MYFLVPAVLATTFIAPQWETALECTGPPDVIYVFDVAAVSLEGDPRPDNETWSSIYEAFQPIYPYGECNQNRVPLSGACCYSTALLELTKNFQSGYAQVTTESKIVDTFPNNAIGSNYCHLSQSAGGLLGYKDLFIHSDGNCVADHHRCFANNTVALYSNLSCSGTAQYFDSSVQSSQLTSLYGQINLEPKKVESGSSHVSWVTVQPVELAGSNYNLAPAQLEILFAILSLLTNICGGIYSLMLYRKTKKSGLLYMCGSQALWLLNSVLFIAYSATTFQDAKSFYIYIEVLGITSNLTRLSSMLYTTYFLITILRSNRLIRIALYSFLAIVHILLTGGKYLYYWAFSNHLSEFILLTTVTSRYYSLLMILWDLVPPLVVIWMVTKITSTPKLLLIHRCDPYFWQVILLNSLNFIVMVICHILMFNSVLLGSDAWFSMCNYVQFFMNPAHSVLSLILIERMKHIVHNVREVDSRSTNGIKSTVIGAQTSTIAAKNKGDTIFPKEPSSQ